MNSKGEQLSGVSLKLTNQRYKINIFTILYLQGMVVVEIKDINNNAPKFLQCSSYHPTVMEKENIGTPVIQVLLGSFLITKIIKYL